MSSAGRWTDPRATSEGTLSGETTERDLPGGLRFERYLWFIRQRWLAIGGVVTTVTMAWWKGWVTSAPALYGVALFMVAYNLGFLAAVPWLQAGDRRRRRQAISFQFLCDLAALTFLLHWSGGIQNPFAFFFAFHMALAGILLRPRQTLIIGVLAWVLFGGTIVAENRGWIQHYPLLLGRGGQELPAFGMEEGLFLLGYLVAFGSMLAGVAYFTQSLESQRRIANMRARSRERIALSRERMARIGEISTGLVHTIRNPLHGVMNCVELLRESKAAGGDPEEQEELFGMICEGLDRIKSVTNRLMTMTRDSDIHPDSVEVDVLVGEAVRFLHTRPQDRGVKIVAKLDELPTIRVDTDRVIEVLINVLDNAVAACSKGDCVSINGWVDGSTRLCLEIADTGTGITEENLEHIFDPFFTTKPLGEGTGLGLALARRVVEAHGGSIHVESRLGEGTRFFLCFPLEEEDAGEVGFLASAVPSPLPSDVPDTPSREAPAW